MNSIATARFINCRFKGLDKFIAYKRLNMTSPFRYDRWRFGKELDDYNNWLAKNLIIEMDPDIVREDPENNDLTERLSRHITYKDDVKEEKKR